MHKRRGPACYSRVCQLSYVGEVQPVLKQDSGNHCWFYLFGVWITRESYGILPRLPRWTTWEECV